MTAAEYRTHAFPDMTVEQIQRCIDSGALVGIRTDGTLSDIQRHRGGTDR